MNNVLELKGKRFIQANKSGGGGGAAINGKEIVTADKMLRLANKLHQIKEFWQTQKRPFEGLFISVHYNKIAAKSNRISGLFKGKDSNFSIVGAKFNQEKTRHIITYYLEEIDLENSVQLLSEAIEVMKAHFPKGIQKTIFDNRKWMDAIPYDNFGVSKSSFKQVVADVSYIADFAIEEPEWEKKQSIITLYDIGLDIKSLLKEIGIDILSGRILDNQTIFLDENQLEILFEKMPYLVSMATVDLSELSPTDFIEEKTQDLLYIPSPTIEPTIGVIDTLFDETVYFHEWVKAYEMIDENIPKSSRDYRHGTAVSSLIVDGPKLNPWLDDGCGRFRVRHFGVATGGQFSSFSIIKKIKEIILKNRDIKVWNISMGSNQEINDNFISAEAAVLDQIQYENDVIFVIAGTNKPNESIEKIGSPADSINGMVVNAVTRQGLSTKYTRKGLALSFFAKPDVSYYGGSEEQYIRVCEPLGAANVAGTSFAAPWIARKLSYLIDILGFSKEVAKALIIDAARGWKESPTPEEVAVYGHGIVPIRMEEIVQSREDEIKFIVSDISEKWNTYNYYFPVPLKGEEYPYIAKATMCYFPMCNRSQGVDYTNTELNLHFGRIKDGKLKDIVGDKQNQENLDSGEISYILEEEARERFRKWDNVKYIAEVPRPGMRPRKSYANKNWGMEIKTSNRLNPEDGKGIRFGVVVTLKEMKGINRIDEFIRNCTLNGWLVNQIDIQSRVDIHRKVNEEIEWR
ncbi:S8 family peptidase [Clostridiales bacterium COT073_COT-073]|nr:S8 family peptidase [Clostridiales bacterium COT073_COT-073]